jgi:carbon monoxide dehydrogenase subunit G
MEMTGEQIIALPQQAVWEGLNDPAVLKDCIVGCDSLERVSESEFRIVLTAAVGPVKARFTGKLALLDVNAPNSYSLAFEGSGGAAGFGKGTASVTLSREGAGTRLSYTAKANIGGKLAQIGSRLIDGVAKKMADDFFSKFKERVAPPSAAGGAGAAMPESPAQPAGINPMWYVAGVIALMLIANAMVGLPK